MKTTSTYFSYLIRIWHSGEPSVNGWHASLQDPTSQHILYFETMAELFAFLQNNTLAEPHQTESQTNS